MESFLILLGTAISLAVIIVPIISLVRLNRHNRRLQGVEIALMNARDRILTLEAAAESEAAGETVQPPPQQPAAETPEPADEPELVPDVTPGISQREAAPVRPTAPSLVEQWRTIETFLTTRGLVWLGGIIIAVGGGFLVRFSIDYGLLGPAVRVSMGVILGAALIAGSEWLRRSEMKIEVLPLGPDYIPAAMSGAGIFTLFASVFGAYYLYDFTSPTVAFMLFAALTTVAFLLSFLQGPLIAVLALLGGYSTPILVSTGSGSTIGLFSYLGFLYVGISAIVVFKRWTWLLSGGLLLACLWVLIWILEKPFAADMAFVQIFLLVTLLISAVPLLYDKYYRIAPDRNGEKDIVWQENLPVQNLWAAAGAVVFLSLATGATAEFTGLVLILTGLTALQLFGLARYLEEFNWLQVFLLPLLILPILFYPHFVFAGPENFALLPEGAILRNAVIGFLLIAAGTGYAGLWGAKRPGVWASLSAGIAGLLFLAAYVRFEGAEFAFEWGLGAMAFAAVYLLAAAHVRIYRDVPAMQPVLGAFSVAVTGGVAFSLAIWFDAAILSVALALEVAAISYIYTALPLKSLRIFAMVLVLVTAVRLLLNYNLLDYNFNVDPVINWILYGYGVPTLAFIVAARRFGEDIRDTLVILLEALAIAFAMAFVTLEVRQLMAGGLATGWPRFAEHVTHSLVWLSAGVGLYYRSGLTPNNVITWAWKIILAAGSLYFVLFVLLANNPLVMAVAVGPLPVFNLLILGYGVPVALFAGLTVVARYREERGLMIGFGISTLILLVLYISLEIRHGFHGSIMSTGSASDMEVYAYSLAYILLAGLFMLVGIMRDVYGARQASLALMLLTLAKLALVDVWNLQGLYRVVSFIGLGFALLAVVYVYRRYAAPAEEED